MNIEILEDEISRLVDTIKKGRDKACRISNAFHEKLFIARKSRRPHVNKMVLVPFWDDLADLASRAAEAAVEKKILSSFRRLSPEEAVSGVVSQNWCAYFCFIDVEDESLDWQTVRLVLQQLADAVRRYKHSRLVVLSSVPDFPSPPDGITTLEERELSYYFECAIPEEKRTPAIRAAVRLEQICRGVLPLAKNRIVLLRTPSVFGPGCRDRRTTPLEARLKDIAAAGTISLDTRDFQIRRSSTYVTDVLKFTFTAVYSAKNGNVYHIAGAPGTLADDLLALRARLPGELAFRVEAEPVATPDCCIVGTSKHAVAEYRWRVGKRKALSGFYSYYRRLYTPRDEALYRTWCWITGQTYNLEKQLRNYGGKLARLKALDLEVYKVVADICKRHNIEFLLGGGNTLGAVRYGKSIPWDDDIDICFEREEFEKFRRVAPKELPSRYIFGDPLAGPNGHYTFPKIRLRDTFFSQPRTSRFAMNDGVYMDCFIYDKTSQSRFCQKLQTLFVGFILTLINYKWYNFPTHKGVFFYIGRLFMPFIRLMPWRFIHWLSDVSLTLYRRTKSPVYFEGTGLHMYNLGFPKTNFSPVHEVDYEGIKVPIPVNSDAYLTYLYGSSYLPDPPISKRASGHYFVRLDLGEHLFETHDVPQFRQVDLRGELFEVDLT